MSDHLCFLGTLESDFIIFKVMAFFLSLHFTPFACWPKSGTSMLEVLGARISLHTNRGGAREGLEGAIAPLSEHASTPPPRWKVQNNFFGDFS